MELEPWEALDVDDSDLSAFLRPCKRPHHSHSNSNSNSSPESPQSQTLTPLIPGPAGAVQAAMMHRRAHTSPEEEPLPTQEFIRRVVQHGHESDHDFTTDAWHSAFHFLRSQSQLMLVDDADSVTPPTPLNSITSLARVPQVVAVVKSCTPNGFGDMMLTLKDPTGTVCASVHHKVFTEGEFGRDLIVGSVLVLQKVAVFSPTPAACYLNITLRNIVKVFSKDSGPPSEQIHHALSVRQTTEDTERQQVSRMLGSTFSLPRDRTEGVKASHGLDSRSFARERHEKSSILGNTFSPPQETTEGIMSNSRLDSRFLAKQILEKSWMPSDSFSLPQERTEGIMTNLRLDSRFRVLTDADKQKGENLGVPSCHSDDGSDRNQKTVLDRENLSPRQDNKVTSDGELEIEMNDQSNRPKPGEGDNLTCSARSSTSTNSVYVSTGHNTEVKNHIEKQNEISNPVSSIPHWTDEQLNELLAFD